MLIFEKANHKHRFPFATWGLILLMGGLLLFVDPNSLELIPANKLGLSILTSIFAHTGIVHYLSNVIYLYIFGDNVEDVLGHIMYVIAFIILGLLGNFFYVLTHLDSYRPVVGASGAVSGILGMYFILFPNVKASVAIRWHSIENIRASVAILFWLIYQVALSIVGLHFSLGMAFGAHFVGFLGGLLLGFVFSKLGYLDRHEERIRKSMGNKLTVLCPSCSTPKIVKKYGQYTCAVCKSYFSFDVTGKRLIS
ncbi:rhomboid family intramembrane serine protease [Leptospira neocaledonica]|uniref:Peptidase S54 rhomboid domain-containing protein n=1 Tax=Leptospira neocaledonica TaxID=2023192 RepID=A0A2M9ZT26_9LEPT|nr:rhomboid family intramembrane serine protease [Leptospira neocaledonica]PJZ75247.1 hypothetical protein CH365_19880 [Leptospira neocaledonica]